MRGPRAPLRRSAGAPGGCGTPPLRPAARAGSPLRLRPLHGMQPPHGGRHRPERRVLLSRYGPRVRHIERCIPYPYVLHTRAWLRTGTRRRANEKSLSSENPGFPLVRRERDSNPRYSCPYTAFRVRPDRPLRHLSLCCGVAFRLSPPRNFRFGTANIDIFFGNYYFLQEIFDFFDFFLRTAPFSALCLI